MQVLIRRADSNVVWTEERVPMADFISLIIKANNGTYEISGSDDLLVIRSNDARIVIEPRQSNQVNLRLT